MKNLWLLVILFSCEKDFTPMVPKLAPCTQIVIADHLWLGEHKDTLRARLNLNFEIGEPNFMYLLSDSLGSHMVFAYIQDTSIVAFQWYGQPIPVDNIWDEGFRDQVENMYLYGEKCGIEWDREFKLVDMLNTNEWEVDTIALYYGQPDGCGGVTYKLMTCAYYSGNYLRIALIQASKKGFIGEGLIK
jgi:hypothetical protein